MKANLGKKIVLIVTVILLLTTLAGVWVSGAIFSHAYSSALQSKSALAGGFLATQVDRLLSLGIPLEELVGFDVQCREIVENNEEITFAMVVDPNGEILFHNEPSRHGTVVSQEWLKRIQAFAVGSPPFSPGPDHDPVTLVPLSDAGGRNIGYIAVGFSERVVTQATKRLVAYSAFASFLLSGIAVFFLVSTLSTWIGKPLVRLRDAIGSIASRGSGFSGKVVVKGDDEIGEIAAAFNRMTTRLLQTTVSRDYADAIVESVTDALFVADGDQVIVRANRAATEMLGYEKEALLGSRMAMLFPEDERPEGMHLKLHHAGNRTVGNRQLHFVAKGGEKIPVLFSVSSFRDIQGQLFRIATGKEITELKYLEREREALIEKLRSALAEVRRLGGLLPICASCKKIRNDAGYWERIEKYIEKRSEATFTHGICPECERKLYSFDSPENQQSCPDNGDGRDKGPRRSANDHMTGNVTTASPKKEGR